MTIERDVLTGPEFRRKLGWGKDRFYAAMHSGRFAHLVALNASSLHRTVYVRAKVDAWIAETSRVQALRLAGERPSRDLQKASA